MPIDQLPAEVVTPTRSELKELWLRRFRTLVPTADTGPKTQPDLRASLAADSLLPLYAIGRRASDNLLVTEARGDAVDQWLEIEGLDERKEAAGATGFVTVSASASGAQVVAGDELVNEVTSIRYEALQTATFQDGDPCPVQAVDTGPETDLLAGVVLKWTSGRPGRAATAVVATGGLTGGRRLETDEEAVQRILDASADPADSGNEAEYIDAIEKTPGIPVQKAFAYSATHGPGTASYAFTVFPAVPGGSRAPTALQRAAVENYVVGLFPGDDGAFFVETVDVNTSIVYRLTWAEEAEGWVDLVQWPPYLAPSGGPGAIIVDSAASATVFTLETDDGDYTGIAQPQDGQSIAFYDPGQRKFVRKTILSFTGTGPWVITCDTTNGVSDTSYTPAVGQRACPWSPSLDLLLPKLLEYFDGIGPGEMFATFYDEGRRLRRQPLPPKHWPYKLTSKGLEQALDLEAVADGNVVEGDGVFPAIGTPGTLVRILKLLHVTAFPE